MKTSRKPRPLVREGGVLRDARLVVIATEGSGTEPRYFALFGSRRVKVVVIPSEGGRSAPSHVLANLESYRRAYQLDGSDQLWLVADRDGWTEKMCSEVACEAGQRRFGLAISNPCFELWLVLHLEGEPPDLRALADCAALCARLRAGLGGYTKSGFDAERLRPGIARAIARARTLDVDPDARWSNQTATRVYRVVESILSL